jgi:hypothetical protein
MPILKVIGRGAEHQLSVALRLARARGHRVEADEEFASVGRLFEWRPLTDSSVKLRA